MNKKDYYSYSRIRTFDHCNRYYYYHYQLGLPTTPNYQAEFSTHMIHVPIAAFYKNDETMDFEQQWATLEALALPKPKNKIYSLLKAVHMCHKYWRDYGHIDMEEYELGSAEEKLYDDDREFQSIPDLVLFAKGDVVNRKTMILDHKVSAYDAKPLPNFHRQLLSQALTVGKHFYYRLGPSKRNFFIGINHFNLHTETVERTVIPLDLKQVEEYYREYEYKKQQIASCHTANMWPKNAPDACVKYYGKQKKICEFWKRCEGTENVPGMPGPSTPLVPGQVSVSPE